MKQNIICKTLAVAVIILFVGIGVQPAFAVDISNISPSESIEDCGCEVNDNVNLVRLERLFNRIDSLIDRVELSTKLITPLFKDNPEVIKISEELSEEIRPLKELNEDLKTGKTSQDFPLICNIILNVALSSLAFSIFFDFCNLRILSWMFYNIAMTFATIYNVELFNCPPWSPI